MEAGRKENWYLNTYIIVFLLLQIAYLLVKDEFTNDYIETALIILLVPIIMRIPFALNPKNKGKSFIKHYLIYDLKFLPVVVLVCYGLNWILKLIEGYINNIEPIYQAIINNVLIAIIIISPAIISWIFREQED